ncbi:15751_t:CDS:2, partial [Acaulospora colombiana]
RSQAGGAPLRRQDSPESPRANVGSPVRNIVGALQVRLNGLMEEYGAHAESPIILRFKAIPNKLWWMAKGQQVPDYTSLETANKSINDWLGNPQAQALLHNLRNLFLVVTLFLKLTKIELVHKSVLKWLKLDSPEPGAPSLSIYYKKHPMVGLKAILKDIPVLNLNKGQMVNNINNSWEQHSCAVPGCLTSRVSLLGVPSRRCSSRRLLKCRDARRFSHCSQEFPDLIR